MVIISYRYGIKWGAFSGLTAAIIQLLFGLENFSWVSGIASYLILIFADYIVAFGILGFGGMFKNKIESQTISLTLGSIFVSLVRYACHFVSGVTIWSGYAPEGTPVWQYSITYNGSYMIPELIITAVGAFMVAKIFDLSSPEIKVLKKSQTVKSK